MHLYGDVIGFRECLAKKACRARKAWRVPWDLTASQALLVRRDPTALRAPWAAWDHRACRDQLVSQCDIRVRAAFKTVPC